MPIPELEVDFNELLESEDGRPSVLLSRDDVKKDKNGEPVTIYENMPVIVFVDDVNSFDEPDRLIAKGVAKINHSNWKNVKWLCEFTSHRDIVHENEDNFWQLIQ